MSAAVLAIDTSFGPIGLAVCDEAGGKLAAVEIVDALGAQAEKLAPAVQTMLRDANLAPADIRRIAVTVGPGAFTGVRVGLAFAKGMSLALKVPVLGFSTLHCLAEQAARSEPDVKLNVVAIDARKEEVYLAAYDKTKATIEPALCPIGEAIEILRNLSPASAAISGSGARLLLPLLGDRAAHFRQLPISSIDPLTLARMALHADPESYPPRPEYLRAPDAKLPT